MLMHAVRAALAEEPTPPRDPDLFSSNELFGQPGIYPAGTPMVPASGAAPDDDAARSLVTADAGAAALARYDDPGLGRVAPAPVVRAGLALLTGTAGEPLLDALDDHDQIGLGEPAAPGRIVGPSGADGRIVVNERYRAEHPALLMPSLAHSLLWTGPGAGLSEEVVLHALLATLHAQSLARRPGLAHAGTELARRQNSLTITLLNSRRPGEATVRVVAPDGLGTIPGGAPAMQTPDFASIPFASGDDPLRPTPVVLASVLGGFTGEAQPARYDRSLVESFELADDTPGVGPVERLRVAVALGMLDRGAIAAIAEAVGTDAAKVAADLDLGAALACWP